MDARGGFLSRPWDAQPQAPIELRAEFAHYLVSASLGTARNLGGANYPWAWPQFVASRSGRSGAIVSTASAPALVSDSTFAIPADGNATIIIALDSNPSSGAANFSLESTPTDPINFNCFLPFSGDGKAYFRWGANETEGVSAVSGTALGTTGVFVLSTGPAGMQIWQNGVLLASNSANPLRSGSTNSLYGGSGSTGRIQTVPLFAGFRAQFSRSVNRELSLNPWQLFAPRRIYIPTAPAATGLPTLTSSTYKPGTLTSSGWTARITAS